VQAAGLVPIVEPELLIEGVHTAQEFAAATERTLGAVYAALSSAQVHLEVRVLASTGTAWHVYDRAIQHCTQR
jgi:fructose-bisphosphate aldolase, class I